MPGYNFSKRAFLSTVLRTALIYRVITAITAGAQEALSAPRSKEYTMPGPNVSGIAESAPLWNSTETPGGVSNGHKSGVDEDSLLALLLEDSPNVDERLPSRGFESTSPIPPRSSKKPSAYASSVGCALSRFNLRLVLHMRLFV